MAENKNLTQPAEVLRAVFEEGLDAGNKEVALEYLADEVEVLQGGFGDSLPAEKVWQSHQMEYEAFPDYSQEFIDIWEAGDMAFARYTASGTFENPIAMGETSIEPTGESFTITGVMMARVEDGELTGYASYSERWDMFLQLGLVEMEDL